MSATWTEVIIKLSEKPFNFVKWFVYLKPLFGTGIEFKNSVRISDFFNMD